MRCQTGRGDGPGCRCGIAGVRGWGEAVPAEAEIFSLRKGRERRAGEMAKKNEPEKQNKARAS